MEEDLRICTKCGIVFDLKFRQNKDCPLCHSEEYMQIE
jgi:predicted Zn-ribbon and HTH transcriptional regulator